MWRRVSELEREVKLGVPGGRQGTGNHLAGALGWVPLETEKGCEVGSSLRRCFQEWCTEVGAVRGGDVLGRRGYRRGWWAQSPRIS